MEKAVELGMTEFKDDRHKCVECGKYKKNAWRGKCHAEKIQYPYEMNRCNMFTSKVLQTTETFWEVTEEKPFWEI